GQEGYGRAPIGRAPLAFSSDFKLFASSSDVGERLGTVLLSELTPPVGEPLYVVDPLGLGVTKNCTIGARGAEDILDIQCSKKDAPSGWVFSASDQKLLGYTDGKVGYSVVGFVKNSSLMKELAKAPPVVRVPERLSGFVPVDSRFPI